MKAVDVFTILHVFGKNSTLTETLMEQDIFFLFPSTTPGVEVYDEAVFTGVGVKRNGPFAGTDTKPDYSLPFPAKTKLAGSGCRGIILSRGQATNSGAGVTVKRIRTRDEDGMQQEVFQIGYPDPRETWTPLWERMLRR